MNLAILALAAAGAATQAPPEVAYCTEAGPLFVSIEGSRFKARYTISDKKISGTIDGIIHDNMGTALWQDPDGWGRIYLFFNQDRSRYVTGYNNESRPGHWYGPWAGTRADVVKPGTNGLICP